MEITEVKNILGITTTKHDTYLNTVVPLIVEDVKEYCHNDFLVDGIETLPGGVKIAVAKMAQSEMNQSGLKSRTIGEVSYSYETGIPDSIKDKLKKYRKLRFS